MVFGGREDDRFISHTTKFSKPSILLNTLQTKVASRAKYENRPSIDRGLRVASLCQISISSSIILHSFCPLASDTESPAMTGFSDSFCQFWKSVLHSIPLCKQKTRQTTVQSHYRDSPKVTQAWKVIAETQFLQF